MTILCIWAWERFRPSVWKWLQKKNEKEKKRYMMFNFHWQKPRNKARPLNTAKLWWKDCQFWILRLAVFTRFPANRDCLLKLYMLVKSARTVSRELHWGKRVYIGLTSWLTEGVVTILCFCATCLHAGYHRPNIIGVQEGIVLRGQKNCPENKSLL